MTTFQLFHGDCLDILPMLDAGSVDLVLCDPPYGTTQNKWDAVIPFEAMWPALWRVCRGPVVLTAQSPFDKALGASALNDLKYEWVWEKSKATGHLNAKKQPMKAHENILVFYKKQPLYRPQKVPGEPYKARGGASKHDNYGKFDAVREGSADGSRFPRSVLRFKHETNPQHPTAKPVGLLEYLIRTYTNPGDTVLDFTMGSGSTGVACANTSRNFIGIELDPTYFAAAKARVEAAYAQQLVGVFA